MKIYHADVYWKFSNEKRLYLFRVECCKSREEARQAWEQDKHCLLAWHKGVNPRIVKIIFPIEGK